MLRNHFKISLRNLARQKGYAFINVVGLAIGIASCLLIGLHVWDELRFDRFHAHADEIYRLAFSDSTRDVWSGVTPALIGPDLKAYVPGVKEVVRFERRRNTVLGHGETRFTESDLYYADASLFDVFSFRLLRGDPHTALAAPDQIVLTETLARKYFGDDDPMGQSVVDEAGTAYVVSGVVADVPYYSHLFFSGLISFATLGDTSTDPWQNQGYTFARVPGDVSQVASRLPAFYDEHLSDRWAVKGLALHLEPLTRLYLYSDSLVGDVKHGDVRSLYLFSCIGLLILLIACINYVNLATARSVRRAREVGVRKALGAGRRQLAAQFLGEAMLTTLAAAVLAVVLVEAALPFYNQMMDKQLAVRYLSEPRLLVSMAVLVVGVGIAAGIYPAMVLARFKPVRALNASRSEAGGASSRLRQAMVVVQFTAAIVLLASTLVIKKQLAYVRHQNLGFDHENVVEIPLHEAQSQREALKQEVMKLPGVVSASAAIGAPLGSHLSGTTQRYGEDEAERVPVHVLMVDADYVKTMGLHLVDGKDFSGNPEIDAGAAIVNETAQRILEGTDKKPPEVLPMFGASQVIGVVEDFHTQSLHAPIVPTVLVFYAPWVRQLLVRIRPEHRAETLAALKSTWSAFVPNRPFEYHFLDDTFDALYRSDQRFGRLFDVFATLAMVIGCLGLFGLAAFMAQQRTKEIGIRKVLGAGVPGIVGLLSKDFVVLVGVAFVLAVPAVVFGMDRWLDTFAYRTDVGPAVLFAAGAAVLVVALLTVSYQSIRAATADPVESLRYE